MKFLLMLIFLTGCALPGIQEVTPRQAVGAGAVTGAVATKTIEKVREVFTPHYPLLVRPLEICILEQKITCHIVPCHEDGKCTKEYAWGDWIESNSRVLTVRRSLVASVSVFCDKNADACKHYAGYYEGEKIVIVEDENDK